MRSSPVEYLRLVRCPVNSRRRKRLIHLMTDSLPKRSLLARRLTDSYSRANPYGRYTRMSHAALVYSEDGLNPRVEFGVNVFLVQGSSARRYQLLHVTLDALV